MNYIPDELKNDPDIIDASKKSFELPFGTE